MGGIAFDMTLVSILNKDTICMLSVKLSQIAMDPCSISEV